MQGFGRALCCDTKLVTKLPSLTLCLLSCRFFGRAFTPNLRCAVILTWLPELRHDQQPYKEYVREDFSFGNRAMSKGNESILLDKEGPNLSKFRSSSTAELHPKSHDEKHKQMLFASVMNRLIPIIVWKKLFRNPHTYSSVIGLIWALISFRYATFYYAMSIKSVLVSISFQTAHMDFLYDHCR